MASLSVITRSVARKSFDVLSRRPSTFSAIATRRWATTYYTPGKTNILNLERSMSTQLANDSSPFSFYQTQPTSTSVLRMIMSLPFAVLLTLLRPL